MAWTKIAVNPPVGLRFPPPRFVQLFGLLEDLQLFHGSSSQTALYLRAKESARLIPSCFGRYSTFRRGADAGNGFFPRPNPQSVPCDRGTSRRDERTFWPSNSRLLFQGTSQSAIGCKGYPRA